MPKVNNKPVDETSAQKFQRIAQNRTGNAISAIKLLEATAGVGYESTPEQRAKIVAALEDAVQSVKDIFDGKVKAGSGFKL